MSLTPGQFLSKVVEGTGRKSLLGLIFGLEGLKLIMDGNAGYMKLYKGNTQGKLVGTDQFGNKYYENDDLPYGQKRWVVYADSFNYNPTTVTPEWHSWLHAIGDKPGTKGNFIEPIYKVEPFMTRTGTTTSYAPKGAWAKDRRNWKKFEPWTPPTSS